MPNCRSGNELQSFSAESGCRRNDELQEIFSRESRENSSVESKLNKLLANDNGIISELSEIEKIDKKILQEVEEIEETDKKILHEVEEIEKTDRKILYEVEEIEKIDRKVLQEVEEIEKQLEEIFYGCRHVKVSGPFFAEHSELEVICLNDGSKKKNIEINVYDLACCPKRLIKFNDCFNDKNIELCPLCTKITKLKEDCLKGKLIEIEIVCRNSDIDDVLILSGTKSKEPGNFEKLDNVLLNFAYKCL